MKKIIYLTFAITLITLAMTSCSKSSTKSGIVNAWRVIIDYETISYENGSTTINQSDASVNLNELTIHEDGTWTWNKKSTYNTTVFGGSIFLTIVTTTDKQGTWSPVQKIGKNMNDEYVWFNTLSESTTTAQTVSSANPGFSDTTIYDSKTYETGENVIVYKVVKWDDNELLQLESENTQPNSSGEIINSKLTLIK